MSTIRARFLCLTAIVVLWLPPRTAHAYSVLTHEAIIDLSWERWIVPVLKHRFPNASADELLKAHAFAYGGCIIQDMGYYPFGSKLFSDLVHYVRSGAFVENLIAESSDVNGYAFALGGLAHYAADNAGHPAVNRSVALLYPKLERKYGNEVTYEDDPPAHLKAEFGFDVLQVARGTYAPKAYHDFIGFEVDKPLLERAVRRTYALEFKDLFASVDLALGTYRRAVGSVIPETTKIAWETKKDEILNSRPGTTRSQFLYRVSRASYEKQWGKEYTRPGPVAKILALLLRVLPKVGFLRALSFKLPTAETARLFTASFDRTLDLYHDLLTEVRAKRLRLVNRDFDTGRPTAPGEYRLADDTYANLLDKLANRQFQSTPLAVRDDILRFYRDLDAPIATKQHGQQWRKVVKELAELKGAPAEAGPESSDAVLSSGDLEVLK
jgi:hypothetical protein